MSLLAKAKRLSIKAGLYRPARFLSRLVRPWERREFDALVRFYRDLLPPHSLCFDVGANVGSKSEAMLAAGHRVVAFEPNPEVLPELVARCAHPNWTLMQVALGSASAVHTPFSPESSGRSGMIQDREPSALADRRVPTLTLDTAITTFGRPAFLNIDVGDWEIETLQALDQAVPMMAFEFHRAPANLEATRACLERLATAGSTVNVVNGAGERFAWPDWMPMPQLLEVWGIDVRRVIGMTGRGDLYVRS